MTSKKTGKYKKKSTKKNQAITDSEIKRGYAQYFRNKRLVMSGETYRSRKRTGPEKAPSHYKARY